MFINICKSLLPYNLMPLLKFSTQNTTCDITSTIGVYAKLKPYDTKPFFSIHALIYVNLNLLSTTPCHSSFPNDTYLSLPGGNQYNLSSPVTFSGSTPSFFILPF